jgi:hypothetical protein
MKGLQRIEIKGLLSGKWRFWGTGNPRYWANLDRKRPKKRAGLVINLGRKVSPIVTLTSPTRSGPCSATERASERATPGG